MPALLYRRAAPAWLCNPFWRGKFGCGKVMSKSLPQSLQMRCSWARHLTFYQLTQQRGMCGTEWIRLDQFYPLKTVKQTCKCFYSGFCWYVGMLILAPGMQHYGAQPKVNLITIIGMNGASVRTKCNAKTFNEWTQIIRSIDTATLQASQNQMGTLYFGHFSWSEPE